MPAVITNDHRIVAADSFQTGLKRAPTYIFIGGTTPWVDENVPPVINDTVLDKVFIYSEMIGAKKVNPADVISVMPRIDWRPSAVFDEYRDDVNLIDDNNPETGSPYQFYVITDEFNVYKCIANSYRSVSTVKPSGTTINTFQTPDGYVWKYMYTVRSPDAFSYMTPSWVPCYTLFSNDGSNQWLVQQAAVRGTIDNIYVTDNGTGYLSSNPPNVIITGDGSGATATAQINDIDGTVEQIIVTGAGSDYSTASVTISGGQGVGSEATTVLSPIAGHGADSRSELGAIYKMIRVVFQGSEGGVIPTSVYYRKAGIILFPTQAGVTGTILTVADVANYLEDEVVTGATSGATGTVVAVDTNKKYIYLKDIVGSFLQNEDISSQIYNVTQVFDVFNNKKLPVVASVVASADIDYLSGELLYASTRTQIFRDFNQSEEIRFVLNF
jgi:hypothetical protein